MASLPLKGALQGLTLMTCALYSVPALPCGGGFGEQLEFGDSQTIVVKHEEGQEIYLFQPHFCGPAGGFGLILPVPAPLTGEPKLADSALIGELAELTAPKVETNVICGEAPDVDSAEGGNMVGSSNKGGVSVVSAGKVGVFDWTLLKAESSTSFTEWLDANGFPYSTKATSAFATYVDKHWYFVAFKVSSGIEATNTQRRICGDFGPITLSFPTLQPVIPARIASAVSSSDLDWRVFTIAATELRRPGAQTSTTKAYSGPLTSGELDRHPAVAAFASPGRWLTELHLAVHPTDGDIELDQSPTPTPFRKTITNTKYKDCGTLDCTIRSAPPRSKTTAMLVGALGGLLALAWTRRVRRAGNPPNL